MDWLRFYTYQSVFLIAGDSVSLLIFRKVGSVVQTASRPQDLDAFPENVSGGDVLVGLRNCRV